MFGKMSNIIGTFAFDKSEQKENFETIWTKAELILQLWSTARIFQKQKTGTLKSSWNLNWRRITETSSSRLFKLSA